MIKFYTSFEGLFMTNHESNKIPTPEIIYIGTHTDKLLNFYYQKKFIIGKHTIGYEICLFIPKCKIYIRQRENVSFDHFFVLPRMIIGMVMLMLRGSNVCFEDH